MENRKTINQRKYPIDDLVLPGRKVSAERYAALKYKPGNAPIALRVKPAVKERIQAAAAHDGYAAMATWLRHLAMARADQLGIEPIVDEEHLRSTESESGS